MCRGWHAGDGLPVKGELLGVEALGILGGLFDAHEGGVHGGGGAVVIAEQVHGEGGVEDDGVGPEGKADVDGFIEADLEGPGLGDVEGGEANGLDPGLPVELAFEGDEDADGVAIAFGCQDGAATGGGDVVHGQAGGTGVKFISMKTILSKDITKGSSMPGV